MSNQSKPIAATIKRVRGQSTKMKATRPQPGDKRAPTKFAPADSPFAASPATPVVTFQAGLTIQDVNVFQRAAMGGHPEDRSPGLHLSDIIRDIAIRTGVLKIKDVIDEVANLSLTPYQIEELARLPEFAADPNFTVAACWRIFCGLAFEEYWAATHPELIFHFGEVSRDGIAGTPDAVWPTWLDLGGGNTIARPGPEVLCELKFTWKSTNNPNNWMYEAQIKSYCKMMGIRRARLTILYVNGAYGPFEPQVRIIDYEFSDQELNENWTMIVRHARKHFGLKEAPTT